MWPFNRSKPPRYSSIPQVTNDNGQDSVDELSDALLEQRIVPLAGEITDEQALRIIQQLLFLQYENRAQPITIEISDSPGGSVAATMAIVDTMAFLACPVRTVCRRSAHGGAAIILACGARGQRVLHRDGIVSITQLWGEGTGFEKWGFEQDRKRLSELLQRHTGRTQEEWSVDFQFGHEFGAKLAKEYGMVDRIEE